MNAHKMSFRIAARGLIVQENRLLFVSDEGYYWYIPGGRVEENETLYECVEREVYEETGLRVKTGKLLHVLESFDRRDEQHKLNFYFQTTLLEGSISDTWPDTDGVVQFRRYFSLNEIQTHKTLMPRFLADGHWLEKEDPLNHFYQGCLMMHGFEMLESESA